VSNNHHYHASGLHNQPACLVVADGRQAKVANVAGVGVEAGVDAGVDADESDVGVAEASTQEREW
jgi:hypothetical protein